MPDRDWGPLEWTVVILCACALAVAIGTLAWLILADIEEVMS